MSLGLGIAPGQNGQGYAGWRSYAPGESPIERLPDYGDKAVSLMGRYYSRLHLIPFLPDVYSVAYAQNPLIRAQGLRVIDQMLLDDMVTSGISSWIGNVLTAARVEPADVTDHADHEMAKAIADCYTEQFRRMRGALEGKLQEVLFGGAAYGHSVAALPLCIIPEGRWRGYTGTADIKWLMPHFLEPLHDARGAVVGWAQVDRQSSSVVPFDEREILHYVVGSAMDPARGRSLLLAAHMHWITKTLILRLRNHNAEWAVGRLALKQVKSSQEGGPSKAEFDKFCLEWINEYIERWGIPVPYGVEAELMSSTTIGPDVYNAVLRHADQGILRAIGVAWLLQEEPEFGTRAQSDSTGEHQNNKFRLLRVGFTDLCQTSLIDRTAKINGWPQRLWPRFTMQPQLEDDKGANVTIYLQALGAGAISKQPQDENYIRERIGAPLIKEGTTSPALGAAPAGPLALPAAPLMHAEHLAEKARWWDRPRSKMEERVSFSAIDSGLGGIMQKMADQADAEFARSLASLQHRIEGWVKSDRVSPREIQRRLQQGGLKMDLDGFEAALVNGWTKCYGFGQRAAVDELRSAGAPATLKVPKLAAEAVRFDAAAAPADPYRLGNFAALMKSESFSIRKGYEDRVYSAISDVLMTAYQNGYSEDETIARLREVLKGLAAGHLIEPGKPGADYTQPAVEETTVRTMANNSFNAARNDLYERNDDFVIGTERSEVAEGKDYGRTGLRSHPLSAIVDALKIRMKDPRRRKLTGALHFNERGVDVPITVLDEPVEWSSDAEIDSAIAQGKALSPRFF